MFWEYFITVSIITSQWHITHLHYYIFNTITYLTLSSVFICPVWLHVWTLTLHWDNDTPTHHQKSNGHRVDDVLARHLHYKFVRFEKVSFPQGWLDKACWSILQIASFLRVYHHSKMDAWVMMGDWFLIEENKHCWFGQDQLLSCTGLLRGSKIMLSCTKIWLKAETNHKKCTIHRTSFFFSF